MNVEAWWDEQHGKFNANSSDVFFISGTPDTTVWKNLGTIDMVLGGTIDTALNIGVGTGHDTRVLHSYVRDLHVLDISQIALDRVSDIATCHIDCNTLPEGTFDLAMSHLVSQHMDNHHLSIQLSCVIKSLKQDGIFSMQSAMPYGPIVMDEEAVMFGGCCRTPDDVEHIVSSAGGKIIKMSEPYPVPGGTFFYTHIGRSA